MRRPCLSDSTEDRSRFHAILVYSRGKSVEQFPGAVVVFVFHMLEVSTVDTLFDT